MGVYKEHMGVFGEDVPAKDTKECNETMVQARITYCDLKLLEMALNQKSSSTSRRFPHFRGWRRWLEGLA